MSCDLISNVKCGNLSHFHLPSGGCVLAVCKHTKTKRDHLNAAEANYRVTLFSYSVLYNSERVKDLVGYDAWLDLSRGCPCTNS